MLNEDRLNLLSTALSTAQHSLPHLHLLEVRAYITTNMSSKFYMDSGVTRDRLKEWLPEEVKRNMHCAFNFWI